MVSYIFSHKEWSNNKLSLTYRDSDLKYLEDMAGRYHTDIENMNKIFLKGYYCINTLITGVEKENDYKLIVKVKYYGDKSRHERKENTHQQKIDI
tara:strand:- start:9761 stop:10045 length:285 start_codon:yes stop_codon:yes gene_type:complete